MGEVERELLLALLVYAFHQDVGVQTVIRHLLVWVRAR